MVKAKTILTHPGGAHKDELLACALLVSVHGAPVLRREPEPADLDDPGVLVVDVGGEHDPKRGNFDHHQFPRDYPPTCALTLVLKHLGMYEDAKLLCDWLEPAEWFDTRGPVMTAKWLGVERETLAKLNSPIDITLLRRFAGSSELRPGETLYEVLRWIGQDLIGYLRNIRRRLDELKDVAEVWELNDCLKVLYLPRTDPMPDEPSMGMAAYIQSIGMEKEIVGMVYPDRRGSGFGLSRFNDDERLEFTRVDAEGDVHFAHARGFVAKTTATDPARLKELLRISWLG